jgi:hypothetical protein
MGKGAGKGAGAANEHIDNATAIAEALLATLNGLKFPDISTKSALAPKATDAASAQVNRAIPLIPWGPPLVRLNNASGVRKFSCPHLPPTVCIDGSPQCRKSGTQGQATDTREPNCRAASQRGKGSRKTIQHDLLACFSRPPPPQSDVIYCTPQAHAAGDSDQEARDTAEKNLAKLKAVEDALAAVLAKARKVRACRCCLLSLPFASCRRVSPSRCAPALSVASVLKMLNHPLHRRHYSREKQSSPERTRSY